MKTLNTAILDLSLDDLRKWAGSKILNRGKSYQKHVYDLARTGDGSLLASVSGTDEYETWVGVDEDGALDFFCTCPYDWGVCKHAVALVLAGLKKVKAGDQIPLADDDRALFSDRSEFMAGLDDEPDYDDDMILPEEVEKYEALMRIIDEDEKLLMPGDFLPVAKKISIYTKLSKRLIEKALVVAREKGIKVALNISSEDLASSAMRDWLIKVIADYGVADKVCFEIVESEAFSDLRILESFYSRVKDLGAELAIDDFGSGYSNYEYLTIVKPDYIKIDGSLISKVVHSSDVEALVRHIVLFCKELNIKTVAEFVSSQEILEKVKELGVDYGQGFYLGKPTRLT